MSYHRNIAPDEVRPGRWAGEHVTIVMAVRNGMPCLHQQLESIRVQTHGNWSLIASDDGSDDESRAILDGFSRSLAEGQSNVVDGPCQGYAENFLSVLRRPALRDGWIAFSDQDDVWIPVRLERGIAAFGELPVDLPGLYCSRTWITDAALTPLRLSPRRPRPPAFRNALVQNVAAGNTILLNPAAARLVRGAAGEVKEIVAHDWWVYLLVTGAGGAVIHDDEPTVLYRQHGANQIGANDGILARLRRIYLILSGEYRRWNNINVAALTSSSHRLTAENRKLVAAFGLVRGAGFRRRWKGLRDTGLYRQTALSTLALWIAAAMRRL